MKIPIFKPGDKVKCLSSGTGFKEGEILTVSKGNYVYSSLNNPQDICIDLEPRKNWPCYARLFELVNQEYQIFN